MTIAKQPGRENSGHPQTIIYMSDGFDDFKYIVLMTCKQTNFVFAIPTKEQTARAVSYALIHYIFTISGHPNICLWTKIDP